MFSELSILLDAYQVLTAFLPAVGIGIVFDIIAIKVYAMQGTRIYNVENKIELFNIGNHMHQILLLWWS